MSHSSYEVAVSGGDCSFVLSEDSHVSAETWSACRCRYSASRFYEYSEQAFLHTVQIDLLSSRNHDAADSVGNLFALEDVSGNNKVFKSAVCA